MVFIYGAITIVSAAVSLLVASLVRHWAKSLGLIAIPIARSSHARPTPTGGGLGIVVAGSLAGVPTILAYPGIGIPVLACGVILAAIGFADDRRPVSALGRLMAQLLVMGAVAMVLPVDGLGGWLLVVPVLCGALWINLYNFMDGIDGLAAGEAIFLLLGATLLIAIGQPLALGDPIVWWMVGLAAASAGFFVLNWSPARLFMGDTGSTYLGLMLAVAAIATIGAGWLSLWQWLILAGLFLADSLTTLVRRALRGVPVWQAHKEHAYQALQRRFGSHRPATAVYLGIDLVLLLPLAAAAGWFPWLGWLFTLLAALLLVPAAIVAGAGVPLEHHGDEKGAGGEDRQ